jgi:hypothetical protein
MNIIEVRELVAQRFDSISQSWETETKLVRERQKGTVLNGTAKLSRYSGDSTFRFRLRGSNLESVDSAGFVKITRNDPDAGLEAKIYQ